MDPKDQRTGADLADVVLGVGAGAWQLARWAGRPLRFATGALLDGAVAVAARSGALDRGRQARVELERAVAAVVQAVALRVVDTVLAALDLTELVRRHVDLDALAAELDVDAVVARVDLDAVVARVDLDAAVARVDLDAVVALVDLDAVVRRVDLDAVAAGLDLDRLVATVDLDAAVSRVDLDAVAARIDPNPLVTRVDFDAALSRIDLVGIARGVIDAIDLPEIVRDSTGAMSSDAVRAVRTEGMQADDVVAGFVDRLLRRRRTDGPVVR